MPGQGRRLRRAGDRGGVRRRAARSAHQRHGAAAGRGDRRSAGRRCPARLPAARLRGPGMTRAESIVAGLASVRRRIADAARAAGRAPESVRLVAVSKRMPAADIAVALAAGQVDFGENYAQELRDKRATFEATPPPPGGAAPAWHFIGPLQTNKVKYVAGNVALIHSIDSVALLNEIDNHGTDNACLIQLNQAGESHKRA